MGVMERWGAALYGDPCRECAYDWSIEPEACLALVAGVPARYAGLLTDLDGSQRHPDLDWTAGAYVCHVVDNLRIWAERVAGAALGGGRAVPGYDENLLATARNYPLVPLAGALWSLNRSTRDWRDALTLGLASGVVLEHAGRGKQRAADVARNNAHDAYHHGRDIQRSVDVASGS